MNNVVLPFRSFAYVDAPNLLSQPCYGDVSVRTKHSCVVDDASELHCACGDESFLPLRAYVDALELHSDAFAIARLSLPQRYACACSPLGFELLFVLLLFVLQRSLDSAYESPCDDERACVFSLLPLYFSFS